LVSAEKVEGVVMTKKELEQLVAELKKENLDLREEALKLRSYSKTDHSTIDFLKIKIERVIEIIENYKREDVKLDVLVKCAYHVLLDSTSEKLAADLVGIRNFGIRLDMFVEDKKIPAIKAVRELTRCSLQDAKRFVEAAPVVLTHKGMSFSEAKEAQRILDEGYCKSTILK
jgi:ribosomal protein L7/L12